MSAGRAAHQRVVVDGSNFATEGRTLPSLVQLDEAVRAYMEENPDAEVIVVVDASFEHRVAASERRRFKESELAGEVVTPPAGAVGRGDAFILKIADRIGAVVLSNDSFQEFHEQYPWLFDVGRLIGGKPVPGVGWVFTPRLPVRNPKMARVAKKLAVTLSGGERPTIGTTLTPVAPRATRSRRAAPVEVSVVEVPVEAAPKRPSRATKKVVPAPAPAPVSETPPRATRRRRAAPDEVAPVEVSVVEVPVEAAPKRPSRATKKVVPAPAPAPVSETPAAPAALRRDRQPVNAEGAFAHFLATHRIGGVVEGEVSAFTSHGALVAVILDDGQRVECYAPTTLLGSPPPARARDVVARGDRRRFHLVRVDGERRIAEVSLA